MTHSLAKRIYSTYTECPVTLYRHFRIRFLASCRLKNVTPIWGPSAAVTKLWNCELRNLGLPVIFSRLHGERIRVTRTIYINVLKTKTASVFRTHSSRPKWQQGTTNLLRHTAISLGALKRARLRIQTESGHFEHLL